MFGWFFGGWRGGKLDAACFRRALFSQASWRHPSPSQPSNADEVPVPTQVDSPLGAPLTAELPTQLAQLAAESPCRLPFPFWATVTQETTVTKAPGPGYAEKRLLPPRQEGFQLDLTQFCLCAVVVAGNKTRICQNWDKHRVERTGFG